MFQFSGRFAFLSTFRLSNRTPKITRILTLYQANAATLTLFRKGDKILIKYLYECKGYNAWQFITKFLSKAWTKNSINRLLVKFGTVDGCADAVHTDENVDTVESLLLSQEDKPQSHWTVWEISHEARDQLIISFTDYSQRSASQVLQEKVRSTADWSAQHARVIFGMQFERRRRGKNTWKRTVEKELGNMKLSWSEAESKAQDRAEWRSIVGGLCFGRSWKAKEEVWETITWQQANLHENWNMQTLF